MNYQELLSSVSCQKIFDEPMSKHTTFAIGGKADVFLTPKNEIELLQLLEIAKKNNIPFVFLGNGSNVLVADNGIRGFVISLKGFDSFIISGTTITAGAGVSLPVLARKVAENNLTGMEFAAGIPASVGGAVFMNAGAFDGEMGKIVKTVRVLQKDGSFVSLLSNEIDFSYRCTKLQKENDVVISVLFNLQKGIKDNIFAKMEEFQKRRQNTQPLNYPSAGSVFKRPLNTYAGALIEECGLKGLKIGNAMVSEKHAGFIINLGGATAQNVSDLILKIQEIVFDKKQVELEKEIIILGGEK